MGRRNDRDDETANNPVLSVVIPVLDEEEVLSALLQRLQASLAPHRLSYEIIFVNDGSTDESPRLIREFCYQDPRIVLLNLSRNFGHQASITAGLQASRGQAVVVMDADLQDPPELISEMLSRWRQGNQIVVAQRRSRGEGPLRRFLFGAFYRVLGVLSDYPIQLNSGVFSLMDRRVVFELLAMRERNRFIPGLRSWLGFRQTSVFYDRPDRAAGQPKQTFARLLRYGFDAIFSFSYKPLRVSWIMGMLVSTFCFLYASILLVLRMLQINVVRGFTTPTVLILFLGGVQLVAIGVLGEYMGRIYDEIKARPLFVIEEEVRHMDPPRLGGETH